MVDIRMFVIKFFQLAMLKIFHDKMSEKKGSKAENEARYFRVCTTELSIIEYKE